MTVNHYDKGDLVAVEAVFTDRNDALIDPTAVSFKIKDPNGNITTYVFGTDAELVRDSLGKYHVDVSPGIDGTWQYRYESTGTGQAAEEGQFQVKRGFF